MLQCMIHGMLQCVMHGMLMINICLAAFSGSSYSETVDAEIQISGLEEFDFSDLDDFLDTNLQKEEISFVDLVAELIAGESDDVFARYGRKATDYITAEFSVQKDAMIKMIFIGIAAAFFSNLASVFSNGQIADTGFFITYMLLVTILLGAFSVVAGVGEELLTLVTDFMRALIPAYFLAVGLSGGSITAIGFYELTLAVIAVVEWIFASFILPAIKLYIMIVLTNALATEDFLSKLAELLKTAIEWVLKVLFGLVISINVIQGLAVPGTDATKNAAVQKVVSMIPGIGTGATAISELLLGSGNVIKNGIGAAALIVILILCMIPILKLCIFYFVYQGTAAFLQPVTDARFVNCISSVADGTKLVIRVLVTTMLLFMITIAIICMSTSIS
ncbi:MAG: sporulation protein [Lachnospiraceae bacterium]|nr:sporulation protein [Lachnospiraceae bacterium]